MVKSFGGEKDQRQLMHLIRISNTGVIKWGRTMIRFDLA